MTQAGRRALSATALFLLVGSGALRAQVYSPGRDVTPPSVVRSVPMPHPASEVIIECVIQADASISQSKVVRSSSAEDDQAVLRAIAQWQFEAGRKDGKPVAVRYYISLKGRR